MTDLPPHQPAPVFGYRAASPSPLLAHQDLLLVLELFASRLPDLSAAQQRTLVDLAARLCSQPLLHPGKLNPRYRRILSELQNKFAEDTVYQKG